jgi:hypothetical protein
MSQHFIFVLAAVIIVVILQQVDIQFDLLFNNWLYDAASSWHWWNYITSYHGLTVIYINHGWWPTFALSILVGGLAGLYAYFTD